MIASTADGLINEPNYVDIYTNPSQLTTVINDGAGNSASNNAQIPNYLNQIQNVTLVVSYADFQGFPEQVISTYVFYDNGTQIFNESQVIPTGSSFLNDTTSNLYLGGVPNIDLPYGIGGIISDWAFYNYTLNSSEAIDYYNTALAFDAPTITIGEPLLQNISFSGGTLQNSIFDIDVNASNYSVNLTSALLASNNTTESDRGFYLSTTPNASSTNFDIQLSLPNTTFSGLITNLSFNTTYYAKAYHQSDFGIVYSDNELEINFSPTQATSPEDAEEVLNAFIPLLLLGFLVILAIGSMGLEEFRKDNSSLDNLIFWVIGLVLLGTIILVII
jgi:hypothetical protein